MVTKNPHLTEWQVISSGILTGIVTKTSVAPFERLLLLYQTQGMLNNNSAQTLKYSNMFNAFQTIVKEESIRGLFCGNAINAFRGSLVYTLKFGTNDIMKNFFRKPDGQVTFSNVVTSASIAGMVQKVISYPLDLVSLRIAMGINASTLGNGQYKGVFDCVQRIYTNEGVKGFYKGLGLTIGSGVPYVVLQLVMFEYLQRFTRTVSENDIFNDFFSNNIKTKAFITSSSAGALTALICKTTVFPLDTVRKRLMCNGIDGKEKIYKNSLDCTLKIIRNEGWRALYSGLRPTAIKAVIAGSVQFGTYEWMKSFFVSYNK